MTVFSIKRDGGCGAWEKNAIHAACSVRSVFSAWGMNLAEAVTSKPGCFEKTKMNTHTNIFAEKIYEKDAKPFLGLATKTV